MQCPVFLPGESHGQRSLVGHGPGVVFICLFTWLQQVLVAVSGISGVSREIFPLWHTDPLVATHRLSGSTHVRS